MDKHYGDIPKTISGIELCPTEMLFYQYLPIKLKGSVDDVIVPERLSFTYKVLEESIGDFINSFGSEQFTDSYIYLTVKNLYQTKGKSFNRQGYHSDGFMTDDINYIWSDRQPTVFNTTRFKLTMDDHISMQEMEDQAIKENEFEYLNNTLLRLDQYNIHRVGDCTQAGMRCFIKVSFSKDKYDLIGNAKNYLLDYDWDMRKRDQSRNIPQKLN